MRPAALMRGAMRKPTSPEVGGRLRGNLRHFQQRLEAGIHRPAQRIQAQRREDAILAGQRHGVGDGRNRHDLHERHQQFVLIVRVEAALHQSLRQFESHARAAELLVGIFASRLIGIDDGQRLGHAIGTGQVMVGDDQIDAQALRRFRGREGADAHVDADDQANAGGGGALDHVVAHVVAFANAVRHVEVGRAAAEFDRGLQNDDRHGAVDVVVAVDQNRLFAFDGGVDAVDGGAQARHPLGGVQMRK